MLNSSIWALRQAVGNRHPPDPGCYRPTKHKLHPNTAQRCECLRPELQEQISRQDHHCPGSLPQAHCCSCGYCCPIDQNYSIPKQPSSHPNTGQRCVLNPPRYESQFCRRALLCFASHQQVRVLWSFHRSPTGHKNHCPMQPRFHQSTEQGHGSHQRKSGQLVCPTARHSFATLRRAQRQIRPQRLPADLQGSVPRWRLCRRNTEPSKKHLPPQ